VPGIVIKVDTSQVDKYLKTEAPKQVAFALATALNATAKQAVQDANQAAAQTFAHANAFTRNAAFVLPGQMASKANQSVWVALRPQQEKYLQFEILGGTRTAANNSRIPAQALVLAGSGKDPLKSGFLARLSNQAKAEASRRIAVHAAKGMPKIKGIRAPKRVAANTGIFKMSGHGPAGGPGGFFQRLPGHKLHRLIAFDATSTYKPKWDFYGDVTASVGRNFNKNFQSAMMKALETAT
jgi:hypothetical protein